MTNMSGIMGGILGVKIPLYVVVLRDRHRLTFVGLNSGLAVANETAIDSRSPMKQRSLKKRISPSSQRRRQPHNFDLTIYAMMMRTKQLLCSTTENVTIDNLV